MDATESLHSPLTDEAGQQQCVLCGEWMPMSGHYFDADRSSPTGFRGDCKQCRAENRKARENSRLDERIQRLEETALTFIDKVSTTNVHVPVEVDNVAEELLYVFGGPRGFAQHVLANYLSAKPGSSVRQKALDRIITLFERVDQRTGGALAQKSSEELKDELERRLTQTGLRIVDASTA